MLPQRALYDIPNVTAEEVAYRAGVFVSANACESTMFRAQVRHFESRGVLARVADCGEGWGKGEKNFSYPATIVRLSSSLL